MISSNDIVACICEGNSEKEIISILLEQDSLIFSKEQLLDGELLQGKYRSSKVFSDQYLTMDYGETKIVVLSIQDNQNPYALKTPYSNKTKGTHLVVTAPELEMLMIHSLELYDEYQKVKSAKKPSIFLAEHLKEKTSKIKSKAYIRNFYNDYLLAEAILVHKRKCKVNSSIILLADLLKK